MTRDKHTYIVQLQKSTGEIIERPYSVYWDPAREGAAEQVAEACAAELTVFEGGNVNPQTGQRQVQFVGLTAVLQEEPIAA